MTTEERLRAVAVAARNYMVEVGRAPNNRDEAMIDLAWEQLVRALFSLKPGDLGPKAMEPCNQAEPEATDGS